MSKPAKGSRRSARTNGQEPDKDPELVALGRRIATLRKRAELTQEGLGAAAELHWTYVGQIERGERNPTYKNVLKLARGLGVDASALLPDT